VFGPKKTTSKDHRTPKLIFLDNLQPYPRPATGNWWARRTHVACHTRARRGHRLSLPGQNFKISTTGIESCCRKSVGEWRAVFVFDMPIFSTSFLLHAHFTVSRKQVASGIDSEASHHYQRACIPHRHNSSITRTRINTNEHV
jgi:hypothetical protein